MKLTMEYTTGMAMTGLIPVVYSIVNFIVYRALEQVRNDVVLQNLNVKFIATGVNNYFNFLGRSHCCGNDDVALMNMIGLKVFDPYIDQDNDFKSMVHAWINDNKAGYIRV
jgi:transketolase